MQDANLKILKEASADLMSFSIPMDIGSNKSFAQL